MGVPPCLRARSRWGARGSGGKIAQKLEVTGHRAGKMSTRPSVWIVGSSLVVRLGALVAEDERQRL